MNMKKIISLLLVLSLLCMGIMNVAAEGVGVIPVNITTNNETRDITISGTGIQPEGTTVTLCVWYPDKSLTNLANGESVETVVAYTGDAVLNSDKAFSVSFKLKESDASGVYTVSTFIPGYAAPENKTFEYFNIVRARNVLNTAKTGDANAIRTAFDTGLVDISISANSVYKTYKDVADRTYIASYITNNRPVGDNDAGFADLETKVSTIMNNIAKTRALVLCDRAGVKAGLESDYAVYLISDVDYAVYNGLEDIKKEQFIAEFTKKIRTAKYPEDISKAFTETKNFVINGMIGNLPQVLPSSPGGNGGGGGGGGSRPGSNISVSSSYYPEISTTNTAVTDNFSDLDSCEWAKNSINILANQKILLGKGDGKFYPEENVTREQAVHILCTAFNIKAAAANALPFKDAEFGTWYYNSVRMAYMYNITKGVSEDCFGVGENITRQDLVVLINNTLKYKGLHFEQSDNAVNFDDGDMIADYAKEAVLQMASNGIIKGNGGNLFDPYGNATRAEIAKIIYEVLYKLNLI